jgi:hypothetical protein
MIRTTIARTLVIATIVAGGFGVAGTASAEPNGDSGGMGPARSSTPTTAARRPPPTFRTAPR